MRVFGLLLPLLLAAPSVHASRDELTVSVMAKRAVSGKRLAVRRDRVDVFRALLPRLRGDFTQQARLTDSLGELAAIKSTLNAASTNQIAVLRQITKGSFRVERVDGDVFDVSRRTGQGVRGPSIRMVPERRAMSVGSMNTRVRRDRAGRAWRIGADDRSVSYEYRYIVPNESKAAELTALSGQSFRAGDVLQVAAKQSPEAAPSLEYRLNVTEGGGGHSALHATELVKAGILPASLPAELLVQ